MFHVNFGGGLTNAQLPLVSRYRPSQRSTSKFLRSRTIAADGRAIQEHDPNMLRRSRLQGEMGGCPTMGCPQCRIQDSGRNRCAHRNVQSNRRQSVARRARHKGAYGWRPVQDCRLRVVRQPLWLCSGRLAGCNQLQPNRWGGKAVELAAPAPAPPCDGAPNPAPTVGRPASPSAADAQALGEVFS